MATRTPRVSIGVAVYNGANYVQQSVTSLLAQDFGDIEVVVADNASTDGTDEICRRIAAEDDRVRVLPSDVNRGLAWNHNRTVRASTAPYFKWAAHDDVHDPGYLARCVEVLDARPEVVLAHTRTVDIDPSGEVLERWGPTERATTGTAPERFRDVVLHMRQCFQIYGVIRREVLEATPLMGAFPSSDQPLLAELALHGPFAEIPEELFLHREHPERSMTKFKKGRDRAALFDPGRSTAITFPKWRVGAEFARAVARAPLTAAERRACWAVLPLWTRQQWRPLTKNVIGAGAEVGRRGARRLEGLAGR